MATVLTCLGHFNVEHLLKIIKSSIHWSLHMLTAALMQLGLRGAKLGRGDEELY